MDEVDSGNLIGSSNNANLDDLKNVMVDAIVEEASSNEEEEEQHNDDVDDEDDIEDVEGFEF